MDWKTGLETELDAIQSELRTRSSQYSLKLVESLYDIEQQLELVREMISVVEVATDAAVRKYQPQEIQKLQRSLLSRGVKEDDFVFGDIETDTHLRSRLTYLDSFRSVLSTFLYKRDVLRSGYEQMAHVLDRIHKNQEKLRKKQESAEELQEIITDDQAHKSAALETEAKILKDDNNQIQHQIQAQIRLDLELLGEISQSVFERIGSGETPLSLAAKENSLEAAQLLIENGAETVDFVNPDRIESEQRRRGATHADLYRRSHNNMTEVLSGQHRVSTRRARYRSDLRGRIGSDREAVLQVLSDGTKRSLFQIAQEVWEIHDDELDVEYQNLRRTLSSTLAREVKRRTVFRPSRGFYSTCRFNSPMQAIKVALDERFVKVGQDFDFMNSAVVDALGEFDTREYERRSHVASQQSEYTFKPRPITKKSLNALVGKGSVNIDSRVIPLLGVETKIIKRNGKRFIFDSSDIAALETQQSFDSEGESNVVDIEGHAIKGREYYDNNLLYNEDAPVIRYLNENESVKDEISAYIVTFALKRLSSLSDSRRKNLLKEK